MRKRKYLIGGLIVLAALIYLVYTGFSSSATYYYTVGEVLAQQDTLLEKNVRVSGQVITESIRNNAGGMTLWFEIGDGGQSVPVTYRGVVPDTFRSDGDVVVEGHLTPSGTFEAKTILTKCPSKYEPGN
ncbi:MAG: cytochrome c maturation protein CcmE [Chloroflexota bacterium]